MKLFIICGPTATGKTELGVRLARKFNGEMVSADSRQVYKGMDIGTGKDLSVYGDVPVHMLDVASPKKSFSVAQYSELASKALRDIWSRGKLPILVGGTGLYIKALVDGIGTLNIPPSEQLRKEYDGKTVSELFGILAALNPKKARSINESDRKNPRRLIRAIEIVKWNIEYGIANVEENKKDILMIGLSASPEVLRQKIDIRINGWVKEGAQDEVKKLIAEGMSWNSQAINAIGYREWKPYFEGKSDKRSLTLRDKEKVISEWKKNEWRYAKRQLTWFKKDKRVNWFSIEDPNWVQSVEKKVRQWYNSYYADD